MIAETYEVRGYFEEASCPDIVVGRANDIVQRVGSNANLDRVGRLHGLDAFVCRNPAQGAHVSPITMTATVEAILGAVYLDGGIESVSEVMEILGLVST